MQNDIVVRTLEGLKVCEEWYGKKIPIMEAKFFIAKFNHITFAEVDQIFEHIKREGLIFSPSLDTVQLINNGGLVW
jgi:hypothetical protein